jgi:hypothetical protein
VNPSGTQSTCALGVPPARIRKRVAVALKAWENAVTSSVWPASNVTLRRIVAEPLARFTFARNGHPRPVQVARTVEPAGSRVTLTERSVLPFQVALIRAGLAGESW